MIRNILAVTSWKAIRFVLRILVAIGVVAGAVDVLMGHMENSTSQK